MISRDTESNELSSEPNVLIHWSVRYPAAVLIGMLLISFCFLAWVAFSNGWPVKAIRAITSLCGLLLVALGTWLAVFRRISLVLSVFVLIPAVVASVLVANSLAEALNILSPEVWAIRSSGHHYFQNKPITFETNVGPVELKPSLSDALYDAKYHAPPIGILSAFSLFYFYSLCRLDARQVKLTGPATLIITLSVVAGIVWCKSRRPYHDLSPSDQAAVRELQKFQCRIHISDPGYVTGVDILDPKMDGSVVSSITRFRDIQRVSLHRMVPDDDFQKLLEGCPHLTFLKIDSGRISESAMIGISRIRNLYSLSCSTKFDVGAIEHLSKITKLRSLWLDNSNIQNDELNHIARCKSLSLLSLEATGISDAGIKHLANHPSLRELHLRRTLVSDNCIKHFSTMRLNIVQLSETPFSEAGFEEAKELGINVY